jgi:two-component system, NarL family, invasion response regulator UvrY
LNPAGTSGAKSVRVLLGDDHRIVREGLKQVFAETDDILVVAEAQSGRSLIACLTSLMTHHDTGSTQNPPRAPQVDLVLLDIAMPESDGLEVLQHLRKAWPNLPVLMLSTYPEQQYAVRCIKLGAAGYLNKSADPDEMILAVRKAAAGGVYVSPATAEALATAVAGASAKTGPEALSHREHQVYRLLITGQSVTQIGAQLGLATNTVSTYRARILEKTGTKNDVELALYGERHAKR